MSATTHTYPPYLMSETDAAHYLGISPRSLRALQARGDITPVKALNAKKAFLREDLEAWATNLPEWEIRVFNPNTKK